jgi:uncharacterized membrane protein YozB (DUF420 family)
MFKRAFAAVSAVLAALVAIVVSAPSFAFADGLTVPTLSTADLYAIASAVIVVAAAVFVIRRGLGLLR